MSEDPKKIDEASPMEIVEEQVTPVQLTDREKRKLRRLNRKKRIADGVIKPRPKKDTKELSLWRDCTVKITSKKSVVHKFIGPEKKINPVYEEVLKLYREQVSKKEKPVKESKEEPVPVQDVPVSSSDVPSDLPKPEEMPK